MTDVHEIMLAAGDVKLSALLAEPTHAPPRAVIVAVHGSGMRAGYFHGQATPELSLLALGARLGFTVLSIDRPGYGLSALRLPKGQELNGQVTTLLAALTDFTRSRPTGAGLFLLAHSHGGKLALAVAADERRPNFIGADVSGVGYRYAEDVRSMPAFDTRAAQLKHWGPLGLYPPDTFRLAASLTATVPEREQEELLGWPDVFADIIGRVNIPLRFTFAQHERWWSHDEEALTELAELLPTGARMERLPNAGHNISLGWAARSYHLKALAFLEECLVSREVGQQGADSP
ncbi:alpha/beta hydrolase [Nocardiopsis ansamitocini]|uniref:Thioesterase n=1 Tax=Nocardiopsis ansamitocini TaxID=1670832 RepID=A0A9W6P7Z0_9ACTN|nr:alpha/beta fold hydrolase [Nocardiopsis ansamitocini]GLU48681.1 thioesterase [Nocardiopsis ansamitocini]